MAQPNESNDSTNDLQTNNPLAKLRNGLLLLLYDYRTRARGVSKIDKQMMVCGGILNLHTYLRVGERAVSFF